jgi:pilus assembly protein TadC
VKNIGDKFEHTVKKWFPHLENELRMAQMRDSPARFVRLAFLLALVFSLNISVLVFVILLGTDIVLFTIPIFFVMLLMLTLLFLQIPKFNIARVRKDIESDIFVPSRMLLTMLESGSSIVTALEKVAYTNAKSSKYFGLIATRIYLGKPLSEALDEAVKYTPSESFRRVLQPIRKSLKTGTDVQKNLTSVLEDLVKDKAIEIERYEKRLGALSLFYMIFGVIIPAISVVVISVILSVMGLEIRFFPFLFIMLFLTLLIHFLFIKSFHNIRPLMRQ